LTSLRFTHRSDARSGLFTASRPTANPKGNHIMSVKILAPKEVQDKVTLGALLVDIREADEHGREWIKGAYNLPLSKLETGLPKGLQEIIFHCRSGNRTIVNSQRLASVTKGRQIFIMEGGIEAWRDAGFPTAQNERRPIEIMRQVQIAAGSLGAAGSALGLMVHPAFHALPLIVGLGLVFAGATGFCGMAKVLALAPWNKSMLAPQPA
jgi:rhodanese-related sulfurtransferase